MMKYLSRIVIFGFIVAAAACSGEPAEEEIAAEMTAAPEIEIDPQAQAAARRLAARLGDGLDLVRTQRGLAEIAYTQPVASRERIDGTRYIVTTIRIQNLAEYAIAGFQVDEFWFDADGNTVTGDRVRIAEPMMTGEIRDIELRVPRVSTMDRSNYEFSHQNGDILATLFDEIEDPPEPEEEESEVDEADEADGAN